MRTFEEINEDIRGALGINDVVALRSLAEEMQAHATPRAAAVASNALGAAEALTGKYPLALEHFRRALALHEELGDRLGVARVTNGFGNVYRETGDYPSSLEHFRRALALHEELGDAAGVARVTGNMGNVYRVTADYPSALEHYRRALALHEELGDRAGATRVTGNMGNVYVHTGDYPSALEHYRRALALHEELGDRVGAARVTGNMGHVYEATGDYPSALGHFRRALALHEELGDRTGLARATNGIGKVYRATGDYPSALEHYRRALALCEELGDRAGVASATGNMGNVYQATGDYPSALEHFRRAQTLHEDLGDRAGAALMAGNVIETLMKLDRYDEAAELLERQATMQMDDPAVRAHHHANCAFLAEHRGDLDAARQHLLEALSISTEAGVRSDAAQYHEKLRVLAQQRNDFAGFIEHNAEYQRITEEIRGKEATQRLTMMEAERRMEGERREREKERAVLYSALPKHVADRVIRGEDVSGDHFDHAAVMFLDIVSFTSHTSSMPPSDVVKMLENVFRTIDGICNAHGVIKVKTIGDSYMCFRGDADATINAQSVAHVALDVMQHTFTWPDGTPLQFRVGIHIGPATAGVIGTERLQYDVWGDTVNVASRMESSGEAGRVHVSEAFASELKRNTEYTIQNSINESRDQESHEVPLVTRHLSLVTIERGEIDVKGKGPMNTYWLESTE